MELFRHIVETVNNLVWNTPSFLPLMVVALLSYGIFITLRLGFVQLRRFAHGIKVVSGFYDNPEDTGDVNHFQALSTALSATVGIGNIAGVAIAIHYGGPGALFWMWLTAFLGMATKYSECTLSVMYRDKNPDGSVSGGPMYYISKGLGDNWKWLALGFAGLAVICSFLTGNAVQANTMADTMESAFFIPKWITGLFSAGVVGLVILGGIKRIGRVTARLTPLMAIIYVLGALSILLINYEHVIPSLIFIVKSAFSPEAGAFGIITGTFMNTMVWGVKRGLFSNEAGQGSAPIAHGAAKTEEPVREGVVALLEPFIDTLVICTMTGLVIIITGVWNVKHDSEINLNSLETKITFNNPSAQTLDVENGIITNGKLTKSDVVIDSLFSNYGETKPLNGTISKKGDNFIATTSTGKKITSVYGEVVENGAPLTAMAFESGLSPFFPGGQYIVTLCVFLFAISTSISWSYYGDRAIQFILGDQSIIYYKMVYVVMHFTGAILTLATVWSIGDIALGLMTFPNLIALFALSGVVAAASKKYFDKVKAEREQITD